jgi:transketolase
MPQLSYIPKSEFDYFRTLTGPETTRLELFATACRLNCLYMIAQAGSGHIGTSFSAMDIMATLQAKVLQGVDGELQKTRDVFFSSKGHDVPARYAVLIGSGLLDFDNIHTLRRLNGLPGHPDVETPYSYTNTGSLGMGISKARGMALARRRQGKQGHIFVLTGDGELQEGQFWESLQPTANRGLDEITVIVDHNKFQSDTWVSKVSDLGDLEKKIAAFGWDVKRFDGHHFPQLCALLPPPAKKTGRPRLLIADTVKGKGVSFMEHTSAKPPHDRLYAYHSGAPSAEDYKKGLEELQTRVDQLLSVLGGRALQLTSVTKEAAKPTPGLQRLIPAYADALVKAGEENPNLVVLDADLAKDTGLIPFEQKFPDRFYECGIAEQDMVSQASGMALSGLLPVVHSFACFLSDRPNEQLYNNATEQTKIIYAGSLAGLVPSGPGHSHQCVRDIDALAAMPGMVLVEPSCEQETRMVVEFATKGTKESVYIRLVSIPCDIPYQLPEKYQLKVGQGVTLRDGKDVVIVAYGPVLLPEACKAADTLAKEKISVKVINFPWLNRVDAGWLETAVADYPVLLMLDNHFLIGGQGELLLAALAKCPTTKKQKRLHLGVDGIPRCGTNTEVLQAHGLDAASLAQQIRVAYQEATKVTAGKVSKTKKLAG